MRLKIVLILYLLITPIALTALPVFSDEAIYIHWAQVATNEPSKYAFLPMLDGKPPLHVWTLIPMLKIVQDPLLAGRLISVFIGLVNIVLIGILIRELGGETRDERLAQLAAIILPFWFFHNRMALAEVMLVMWLLLGLVAGMRAYASNKKSLFWTLIFSLAVVRIKHCLCSDIPNDSFAHNFSKNKKTFSYSDDSRGVLSFWRFSTVRWRSDWRVNFSYTSFVSALSVFVCSQC